MDLHRGRKKDSIEQFIESPQIILDTSLSQLRYMILIEGLSTPEDYDQCPYRSHVWCILCRVPVFPVNKYVKLLSEIPRKLSPELYRKIKNDTFRTLMNDKRFHSKVSEESLTRILSAVAISRPDNKVGYVQGMNVLLAPILYSCHRSEPQAFALLHHLVNEQLPLYVTANLDGVHAGLSLVDVVLRIVDPVLSEFLDSKFLKAEIYAFPSVLTLCACTPSLDSVMKLWDFLFAYGTHMNILFVVAQLIMSRSALLRSPQPMKLLRNFPPLRENDIIKLSLSFVPELPKELYDLIVRHGFDPSVPRELKDYLARMKNPTDGHSRPHK
ncbi:hypothetical protein B9J08_00939 [Candidozyma auris]|uniref:Rab-GAP TBC domain-containing protein n=1 Tax=Candidozyma auris TaxID=498019 RepID=A0A2H0ZMG3_CANAR|nr:hypothetical protein QG37_05228 [[Candida] auris]PIS51493.1 hypothetical protein B9J08_003081 [[Candida] auris]